MSRVLQRKIKVLLGEDGVLVRCNCHGFVVTAVAVEVVVILVTLYEIVVHPWVVMMNVVSLVTDVYTTYFFFKSI